MKKHSSISVIIPSYNRATLISDTINNMLSQSVKPFEIIVVDDGSTDNSVEVIQGFGEQVILIKQSNQGPGSARNAGLKIAKGEFIQFMDSDDLASRNKLEVQLEALKQTGADFAYGPWVKCMIGNNRIEFIDDIIQAKAVPQHKSMLEWCLTGWSLVFQNCLFRREILTKAGYYRTDLMPSEDSEYFTRILLAGGKPVFTPGTLVFYREHNVNKITSTGTSSFQRANDWTRYLLITGQLMSQEINSLKLSTLIGLAAHVDIHLQYCRKNRLPLLPLDHPYRTIRIPFKPMVIGLRKLYYRIKAKVTKTNHTHYAFQRMQVGNSQIELANEIGYASNKI